MALKVEDRREPPKRVEEKPRERVQAQPTKEEETPAPKKVEDNNKGREVDVTA